MREVISWPIRVWLVLFSLGLAALISIGVVLSDSMLALAFFLTLIAILFFGYKSRLVIVANKENLQVGRAKIENKYIESVEILDEKAMKFERGPGINPRAFLAIRFWVRGGVKLTLNDNRDPTPYWLVSTNKAEELRAVLGKN
jgi:hypothetical protein